MMKNIKNILLVQQYLLNSNEVGPIFPLGLAYIATSLETNGYNVKVLDLNLHNFPYSKLVETITNFNPFAIGISLRNIDNVDKINFSYFYEELETTLKTIRNTNLNLKIFIGGAGFSIFAKTIMQQQEEIDFGIYLEGEESFPELLNNLNNPQKVKGIYYRKNGDIIFTGKRKPIESLDKFSPPNKKFFDVKKYNKFLSFGIESKRGCVLKCSYCIYPYLDGNKIRLRNTKLVVDEIEQAKQKYFIKEIKFTDSVFNIPNKHAVDILENMIIRKIRIKWSAWFNVKNLDQNFVNLCKKSNCYRMSFSPDGMVKETLKSLGKNFNTGDIYNLLRIVKNNPEIDFRLSVMAMPPNQTFIGMIKTVLFVFKTHVLYKNSKCLVSWIRILPNTKIYNNYFQYSIKEILPKKLNTKSDLFYYDNNINSLIVLIYERVLYFTLSLRKVKKKLIKIKNKIY